MVSNPNILSLKEAIKIVRPLNFETKTAYQNWWTKNRPDNLARDVIKVYVRSKRKEWSEEKKAELWSYYLGKDVLSNQEKNKRWLSYEEASKACRKARIKSQNDFNTRLKEGTLPKGVPGRPYVVYKNKGWPNKALCERNEVSAWGLFLGTGSIQRGQIKYWPFKKARAYVRKMAKRYDLKNDADWRVFTKSDNLPKEIPRNPKREYGQPPWVSLKDWLGRGVDSNKKKSESFLPPKEGMLVIRRLAKEYSITGKELGFQKEWQRFAQTHRVLLQELHIPADPLTVYSKERAIKRLIK